MRHYFFVIPLILIIFIFNYSNIKAEENENDSEIKTLEKNEATDEEEKTIEEKPLEDKTEKEVTNSLAKEIKAISNTSKVIVHYNDTDNKQIEDDDEYEGTVGTRYDIEVKEIDNYEIKSINGELSGTYKSENTEITITYQKVSVHEVDDQDYEEEPQVDDPREELETDGVFFALGFVDESIHDAQDIENPETGDSIYSYLLLLIISPILSYMCLKRLYKLV